MISVAEAQTRLLALCAPLPAETVPLADAAGRVLVTDMQARRDQPPFAASAMDGYALRSADADIGARLRVIGTAAAGHRFDGALGPGESVRIFTGAPVPEGADRVVLQEDTEADEGWVVLGPGIAQGAEAATHIRRRGGDFVTGDRIIAPRRLRPADLALAAAMNLPALGCARRPDIAILATGDELVMPGDSPGPDQIVASNLFALKAMAEAEGAHVRLLPIARDRASSLTAALELAAGADITVTIGGASVGDHDLVAGVAQSLGFEPAFWKIAMRPGKPLMAGAFRGGLLLGLPGNPVSAIVCGLLFLLPALRALQHLPDPLPRTLPGVLGAAVAENGPRAHYMRARLEPTGDGPPRVLPFASQDSARLGVLAEADALLIRAPSAAAAPAGSTVAYLPI